MIGRTNHLALAAAGGVLVGFTLAASIHAEQRPRTDAPGVVRHELLTAPLAQFPGKVVTVFIGEFDPRAETPMHRHPGTELFYVLEGKGVMHVEGRESRNLAAGAVVLVEPERGQDAFVHKAVNVSDTQKMKSLVMVIHNEGTPPALPVEKQ